MWIESITLYNMKNHRDATLEFTPGLNVICGESGTGKSNIITIIEWVFAETVSTQNHMIGPFDEYGSAKIIQQDRNGERYIIEKYTEFEGRKNVFFLNGQVHYANNNKIPSAIKQYNPIKVVSVNGNNYCPQIQKQGDPNFMLDSNQVDRISLCFWGTDVLVLESIKKDTQKNVDKVEKLIQDKQARLNEVAIRIESMSYIADWRNKLTTIRLKKDRFNKVDVDLKRIMALEKELSEIRIAKSKFNSLPSLQTIDQLIAHYMTYNTLVGYEHELSAISVFKEQHSRLLPLSTVDQLIGRYNEIQTINWLLKQIDEISIGLTKYATTVNIIDIDLAINNLNDIAKATTLVTQLEQTVTNRLKEESIIASNPLINIDKLIIDFKNLNLINILVAELDSINVSKSETNLQIDVTNNKITDLEQVLNSITICPLCTQPVERWIN